MPGPGAAWSGWRAAPAASQRCHWYAYSSGWGALQLPGSAVSVCPSTVAPLIVGGARLVGTVGATRSLGAEVAVADPPAFVAVTSTRRLAPPAGGGGEGRSPAGPASSGLSCG